MGCRLSIAAAGDVSFSTIYNHNQYGATELDDFDLQLFGFDLLLLLESDFFR